MYTLNSPPPQVIPRWKKVIQTTTYLGQYLSCHGITGQQWCWPINKLFPGCHHILVTCANHPRHNAKLAHKLVKMH